MRVLYLKAESRAARIEALTEAGMWQTYDEPVYEAVETGEVEEWVRYWHDGEPYTESRSSVRELLHDAMEALPVIELSDEEALAYLIDKGVVTKEVTSEPVVKQTQTGTRQVSVFKSIHPGDALVDIGTYTKGNGVFTEINGEKVEQQVAIEGYHANLMIHGDVPEVLEKISIPRPNNPKNVFA